MLFSILFSNKLDNFIKSFSKKDIISYRLNKKATNPKILAIQRNKVASNF